MSSVTPRDGLSPHISLSLNLWKEEQYLLLGRFVGDFVKVNGVGLVGGVVILIQSWISVYRQSVKAQVRTSEKEFLSSDLLLRSVCTGAVLIRQMNPGTPQRIDNWVLMDQMRVKLKSFVKCNWGGVWLSADCRSRLENISRNIFTATAGWDGPGYSEIQENHYDFPVWKLIDRWTF